MTTGRLYLIRHPSTAPDPAVPASAWGLSAAGQAEVHALVAAPFWDSVTAVYTSDQSKTIVVGEAVQAARGVPFTVVPGLAEAQRDRWLGIDAFHEAQRAFFAQPDAPPVPDWESAHAAGTRFVAALDDILARHPPAESLAVVTHASVLALAVARLRAAALQRAEAPSYDFWQTIGFAAVMAVDRATRLPLTPFLTAPYAGLA